MNFPVNTSFVPEFIDDRKKDLFLYIKSELLSGASENEVLDKLKNKEITEEDLKFAEWVLGYFKWTLSEISDATDEVETEGQEFDNDESDIEEVDEELVVEDEGEDNNAIEDIEDAEDTDYEIDGDLFDKFFDKYMRDEVKTSFQFCFYPSSLPSSSVRVIGGYDVLLFTKELLYLHLNVIAYSELSKEIEITLKNEYNGIEFKKFITEEELERSYDSEDGIYFIESVFDVNKLIPDRNIHEGRLSAFVNNAYDNELICHQEVCYQYADTVFDAFRVDRMAFYPTKNGECLFDGVARTAYVGFKREDDLQIAVQCSVSSIAGCSIKGHNFNYTLYDPTGLLVDNQCADDSLRVIFPDFESDKCSVNCVFSPKEDTFNWIDGRYKVVLYIEEIILLVATINIGSHDLEGEVDVNQAISMSRAISKHNTTPDDAFAKLEKMVGLKRVKEKIHSLSRLSVLAQRRKEIGLPINGTSLHACFVGNPGTGKTTVAEIVGQIYKEMGLLSKGHVVRVERKNLIGRYYDSELRATEQAMESAKGGVLFIDEAYTLYVPDDPRDPGRHVLESLLTALSDENNRDWMLVLAGYPDEIENLMNANPGIKSRVNETFFFDDYDVDELMQIADLYCEQNEYKMTADARKHLQSVIMRDYGARDKHFGNARYVKNLIEQKVLTNMAIRVSRIESPSITHLKTIEVEDIPSIRSEKSQSRGMDGLNKMVGLSSLKRNIMQHLNMVKLANLRMKKNLHTDMPPLHMVFTGNPGTGKTTVADFMGEIYASMGLLSKGDVIRVEKKDLVGEHEGETERKMRLILNRAKGNILFIDEAYQLCSKDGHYDYGENVIDSLLTTLSNDRVDMIVILAGYPKDMERMLDMNEGLRSRFPYTFHFEDYSVDELHKIAIQRATSDGYVLTKRASELLLLLIKREVLCKRSSFGNARFVTRLLSTEILPRMATRLSEMGTEPNEHQLKTIVAADVPISKEEAKRIKCGGFDDKAIDDALGRLDALVGQEKVKRAIHDFVSVARHLNSEGERFVGRGILKWNFVGNSGTGKSTVAVILAEILKGMNLLDRGNIVELRGEQIYNVSEYQCDQVLRQAIERSRYGMLFIDGDAPEFRNINEYRMTNEQLRIKLTSLTAEIGCSGALVIAECNSPRQTVANSLAINGIYDFDHTFFFDDYTSDELFKILSCCLEKHKIVFTNEAECKIRKYIESLCADRSLSFANARTMKHLSRTIHEQVILRVSQDKKSPRNKVLLEDVENYHWQQPRRIGYL